MPMKTIEGYSKEKYTNTSVLLAGGGAKDLSDFIGSISWDSTNKKIKYTPIGGSATDLVTLSWDNIANKPTSLPANGGNADRAKFLETFHQNSTTNTWGSQYPIWAQWSDATNVRLKCTNYTVWTDKANYADSAGNADSAESATQATNLTPENTAHYFRDPNNSAWRGGMIWGNAGSESMSFVVTNSGTRFQFVGGSDIASWTSDTWQNANPYLTIYSNGIVTPGSATASEGFIKSGYNDDYVLLAGGGHKAESDLSVSYASSAGSVNYANSAGSVAWGNVTGKPSTFEPSSHDHDTLYPKKDGTGASGTWGINISGNAATATNAYILKRNVGDIQANDRGSAAYTDALYTGGWASSSLGYATTYGTFIDLSGYSTWYHRLAFNTNGVIEHFMGINTTTLSKVGNLAYTSDIPTSLPANGGNADTVDNEHASAFAHIGAHNNLTASGNEFTFASSGFSGNIWINYRTAGGLNGNITSYQLGNGKGDSLGYILTSSNWSSYISIPSVGNDTNYYPIRSYTSGLQISSYSGSTDCALFVPYAASNQAGVVSTEAQIFSGQKTFSSIRLSTTNFGGYLYFGDDSYAYLAELADDQLTLNATKIFLGISGSQKYYIDDTIFRPVTANSTSSSGIALGSSDYRFTCGYFSDKVYAYKGFYESSDERLKNILNPVKINLDDLSKLRKVYYLWKDRTEDEIQLGMIAQDVQKLYPELVSVDKETGYLSLAYDKLSVLALEAIDVLYKEHKKLKKHVEELEKLLINNKIY